MLPDSQRLRELVTAVAREELLPRFAVAHARSKADGSLVTEADTTAQRRLTEALAHEWPGIGLLGEEMSAEEQQHLLRTGDDLWLLDPLDGTSNFAVGFPYFAVSLALLRGGEVAAGLVYDPLRDECFSAVRGGGASLNGVPLRAEPPPVPLEKGLGLIDFKRLPSELRNRVVNAAPFASQRNLGSAALDWCALAAGRGHVYLHGRQKLWDFAAGWLILKEAGGASCTLEGERVFQATLEPRSVVAAPGDTLFRAWCEWLGVAPASAVV